MALTSTLSRLALHPLVVGAARAVARQVVGDASDAVLGFLQQRFTDHSQHLPRALQQANTQAWKALEIALAGESLLDRCKAALAPAEQRAFAQQVQAFLQSSPLPDLPGDVAGFRRRCLRDLRQAERAGLLAGGRLQPDELARDAAPFARYDRPETLLNAEWQAMAQLAAELRQAGYSDLPRLLELRPPHGSPLLVTAMHYFFRRAVEENAELYRGLSWATWEEMRQEQRQGFAGLADALSAQGQHLEGMLDDILGVLDDIRDEVHGQRQDIQDLGRSVVALMQQLQGSGTLAQMTDEERQLVRGLLKRWRAVPAARRQQLPHLLDAIGTLGFLADEEVPAGPARPAADVVRREKQRFGDISVPRFQESRLCLRLVLGPARRNLCLLAQREVRLGRQRGNDIVLRVLPASPENDTRSRLISSSHALLELKTGEIVWRNLDCANGTMVGDRLIKAREGCVLQQSMMLRPGNALALDCLLHEEADSGEAYRLFEGRLGVPPSADPARTPAVRLTRRDNLPGQEEYLVFQHGLLIGRDPRCPLRLDSPSVAGQHAVIWRLGGSFWLEPLQAEQPTQAGGRVVPLDHLAPLSPGLFLRLGEAELTVAAYGQYGLDLPLGSS